jgi:hypothetical protein
MGLRVGWTPQVPPAYFHRQAAGFAP